MGSGGGGSSSDGGDHKELLESGSYLRRQRPLEQITGHQKQRQNLQHMSAQILIRKIIPYLIGVAFCCFLLYHSSSYVNYHFPISYHPLLDEQSQSSSTQSSQSRLPPPYDHKGKFTGNSVENLPTVSDNSSTPSVEEENLPPNSTSSEQAQEVNVPSSSASEETEEAKLKKVLDKAAMGNKTVIVTTVNAAWTAQNSLLDLLLESFRLGIETEKLLSHVVVIALDQNSYNRCLEVHPHCYALKTEGYDFSAHEAYFMHGDYLKLVWRKIEFMYTVVQLGYSFVFTDADILWFRDPFVHFLEDADIQTSCDHYFGSPTKGSSSTGFYYVRSNNRTVQFFDFWLSSRRNFKRKHDQEVFNLILTDPAMVELGIKVRVLDTAFYGGFCEPSDDLNRVCIMHANCCLGLGAKLRDLRATLEDWKKYMALPSEERTKAPRGWTNWRKCHG